MIPVGAVALVERDGVTNLDSDGWRGPCVSLELVVTGVSSMNVYACADVGGRGRATCHISARRGSRSRACDSENIAALQGILTVVA